MYYAYNNDLKLLYFTKHLNILIVDGSRCRFVIGS